MGRSNSMLSVLVRGVKRTLLTISALVFVVAASASSAWGSLFLTFSGAQAVPGAVVTVQTGGTGALPNIPASQTLRVFLARAGEAATITSPNDSRLILLGHLRIDEEGNGFLRFIVPDVSAGDYTTLTHCVPCASSSSAGGELLSTGPFPGSFVVLGSQDGTSILPVALGAAGAVVALGMAVGWMLRRGR